VQSGLVIFECGIGRPAVPEQKFDCAGVVSYGHSHDATSGVAAQTSEERGLLLQNSLCQFFIADVGGMNKTEPRCTALHEKLEDRLVTELVGDHGAIG